MSRPTGDGKVVLSLTRESAQGPQLSGGLLTLADQVNDVLVDGAQPLAALPVIPLARTRRRSAKSGRRRAARGPAGTGPNPNSLAIHKY